MITCVLLEKKNQPWPLSAKRGFWLLDLQSSNPCHKACCCCCCWDFKSWFSTVVFPQEKIPNFLRIVKSLFLVHIFFFMYLGGGYCTLTGKKHFRMQNYTLCVWLCVCVYIFGIVKIWDRMSPGVSHQPSAITEDEVHSSDKNSGSRWNLAAYIPEENLKACWSKQRGIARGRHQTESRTRQREQGWLFRTQLSLKPRLLFRSWAHIKPKVSMCCFDARGVFSCATTALVSYKNDQNNTSQPLEESIKHFKWDYKTSIHVFFFDP